MRFWTSNPLTEVFKGQPTEIYVTVCSAKKFHVEDTMLTDETKPLLALHGTSYFEYCL
jgi:hypothetical protein